MATDTTGHPLPGNTHPYQALKGTRHQQLAMGIGRQWAPGTSYQQPLVESKHLTGTGHTYWALLHWASPGTMHSYLALGTGWQWVPPGNTPPGTGHRAIVWHQAYLLSTTGHPHNAPPGTTGHRTSLPGTSRHPAPETTEQWTTLDTTRN